MEDRLEDMDPREQRFYDVLGAYLEAEDAGQAPDRALLLTRHPDLKADLEAFFVAQARVATLAHIYVFLLSAHRQGRGRRDTAPTSGNGTTAKQPRIAIGLANFFRGGWNPRSFLTGVGEALMLFPPVPRPSERSDVEAISTDLEKVLFDFATVLQRHGHNLDTSGDKPDVA